MMPRRLLTADRRIRIALAAISVCCVVVVAVLGARYADNYRPGRLDARIDRILRYHLRTHIRLLNHFVDLAGPLLVLACVLVVLGFAIGRRPRAAALAVLGPGLATGLTEVVLKPLVGRRLRGDLSFPSGHTTGAVSIAVVLVVFLLGPNRPKLRLSFRILLCVLAAAAAVVVAAAMVGAGYHYATDTVGGLCVAVAVVLAVSAVIDAVADADVRADAGARTRAGATTTAGRS
jgi:membrane-associated phospholipid phosphatase